MTVVMVPSEGSSTAVPASCISVAFLVFWARTSCGSQSTPASRISPRIGQISSETALVTCNSLVVDVSLTSVVWILQCLLLLFRSHSKPLCWRHLEILIGRTYTVFSFPYNGKLDFFLLHLDEIFQSNTKWKNINAAQSIASFNKILNDTVCPLWSVRCELGRRAAQTCSLTNWGNHVV